MKAASPEKKPQTGEENSAGVAVAPETKPKAVPGKFVRVRVTGEKDDMQEFDVYIVSGDVNVVQKESPLFNIIVGNGVGQAPRALRLRVGAQEISKRVEILEISDCPIVA